MQDQNAPKDRLLRSGDGKRARRRKSVKHLRREALGMRFMQGDPLAQQYRERYYLTMCGLEAPSAMTTNMRPLSPVSARFSVLCADCEAAL